MADTASRPVPDVDLFALLRSAEEALDRVEQSMPQMESAAEVASKVVEAHKRLRKLQADFLRHLILTALSMELSGIQNRKDWRAQFHNTADGIVIEMTPKRSYNKSGEWTPERFAQELDGQRWDNPDWMELCRSLLEVIRDRLESMNFDAAHAQGTFQNATKVLSLLKQGGTP